MNKALSVLLAAALLTALLCACGDVPAAQETPTPQPAAAPAPSETPAPEKAFSRGRIEGQVYESGFLSLRFTAPEGWRFVDDEELSQRMGLSLDIVGEDVFGDAAERAKTIAEQAVVCDMAADAPDGSASVFLTVEDLEAAGNAALTDEQYAALLRAQLMSLTDLRYEAGDPEPSSLAGRPCVTLLARLPDFGMEQRFYLLREGKCMAQISLTGTAGALPDADELFTSL